MEIKDMLNSPEVEEYLSEIYTKEDKKELINNTRNLIKDQNKKNTSWLTTDFMKFMPILLGLNIVNIEREDIEDENDNFIRLNLTCQDETGNTLNYYIGYYNEVVFATLFAWLFDYVDSLSRENKVEDPIMAIIPVQQHQLTNIFYIVHTGFFTEQKIEVLKSMLRWIYVLLY